MKYAWSAPEVMQTSQMDCGPSCLKSVLDGFGIPVHYGRLREACQTDVDGTSVDIIEELACELGLDAQQILVPLNQFELPESAVTPSILITSLPNGLAHFIVVWRSWGPWVQVMDPSSGRHWVSWKQLKERAYLHRMSLDKSVWLGWAQSDAFQQASKRRLMRLGISVADIDLLLKPLFGEGESEPDTEQIAQQLENMNAQWLAIASFDAALTWTEALYQASAIKKVVEALHFLRSQYERARHVDMPWLEIIPRQYWWAIQDDKAADCLNVEASVVVRIQGAAAPKNNEEPASVLTIDPRMKEAEPSPWRVLADMLLPAQKTWLMWLVPILLLAATTLAIQALLFQGLLSASNLLGHSFNTFIPMIFAFIVLAVLIEFPLGNITLALGRQLESQFRIALFEKIPKIHDPYFRTRLLSDMARRSHKLYQLRNFLFLVVSILQQSALVLFTVIGILWLDFSTGLVALVLVIGLLLISVVAQRLMQETVYRAETQSGLLNMIYFDVLKGLRAIRSHSAQKTFEADYEVQLKRWGDTSYKQQVQQSYAVLAMDLVALLCIAALLLGKSFAVDAAVPNLLWFYWLLRLPFMVKHLSSLILQVPLYKVVLAQFIEIVQATELEQIASPHTKGGDVNSSEGELNNPVGLDKESTAVAIEFVDVSLSVSGHSVLQHISLTITPGEHIAIVGESGAGKSSLCELLLGWQSPSSGQLLIDGKMLDGQALRKLRTQMAWVDVSVQLWDRSLLDNINYDHGHGKLMDSGLGQVLTGLKDGLQTPLGEDGKRLSGGEGQRVRIARALGVEGARLVILDEPCRGLDRAAREQLLMQLRKQHAQATFICVTHDISEAIKFPRVLVIGQGQLLEQGNPQDLLAREDSALHHLHTCEQRVLNSLLREQSWQSLRMINGRLHYGSLTETYTATHTSADEVANV